MSVSTLLSVVPGRHLQEDYDAYAEDSMTLTLVFTERCICLQAANETIRDNWGIALHYLIRLNATNSGEKEDFYYWYSTQHAINSSAPPLACDSTISYKTIRKEKESRKSDTNKPGMVS